MKNVGNNSSLDFIPFGVTIKKERKERGWTREEMAEKAGISVAYLTQIENKGQIPSFQKLVYIVKLLDLSIDEFIFSDCIDKSLKTSVRRQLDKIMDTMSEKELYILKTCLMISATLEIKRHNNPD